MEHLWDLLGLCVLVILVYSLISCYHMMQLSSLNRLLFQKLLPRTSLLRSLEADARTKKGAEACPMSKIGDLSMIGFFYRGLSA